MVASCLRLHINWQPLVFLGVPRRCWPCLTALCVSCCYHKMSVVLDSLVNVLCPPNYFKNEKCLLVSLFSMRMLIYPWWPLRCQSGAVNSREVERMLWGSLFYATFFLPSSTSWDTYVNYIYSLSTPSHQLTNYSHINPSTGPNLGPSGSLPYIFSFHFHDNSTR